MFSQLRLNMEIDCLKLKPFSGVLFSRLRSLITFFISTLSFQISETYLDQRRTLHREINQITRGILQSDANPKTSALLYTVCNAQPGESAVSIRRGGVGAVAFSEDMGMLAGGMGSGRIRIWALGAQSLRQMLPPEKLEELDLNDSRIKSKMLHDGDG